MNNQAQTVATNNATTALPAVAVNALDFIDQKFADEKDRDIAYDILCDIVERSACCDAEIDCTEVDENAVIVYMTAPCEFVDNGIGAYEYWGSRCCDHQYAPEVDDGAFIIAPDAAYLATLGLTGTATEDSPVDYSDCREDGDTATCNERVTLTVTDPAKFWLFIDKEIARRVAAKAA